MKRTIALYTDRDSSSDRRIRTAIGISIAICASLVGAYLYFVTATSYAAIERTRAERAAPSLLGDIARMESEFLAVSKAVSLDAARARGLVEIKHQTFVSRTVRSGGISLATHGF